MKRFIKILLCSLICLIALSIGTAYAQAAESFPSETNAFGSNHYIEKTNQEKPFFEEILPAIAANIKENNKHTINPYFDKLPLANNPENFQGLGSTTYADINGKTVTAEAFYRKKGDSLDDPNAGMGLLIYQCIRYKLAHPEKDVEISFSSYRTSATASVCVLPESKYYGYMRSLYTTNYDEHGFVRISYMLTEAARMGIKVTLVNQLSTYGVNHYNPSTKQIKERSRFNYATYYSKALETDCYNKYAPGKKVSDYMDFVKVGWTVGEQTTDMQHVKACTVSDYISTDGKEHKYGVFFTTSNLDENDYLGRNGNGWSQTGIIITNHEYIYRATLNCLKLMYKYSAKEKLQEFRKIVLERNVQQKALFEKGQQSKIPADELIYYPGTKNDSVFELYFTPILGGVDAWDTENNPICYHVDQMAKSTDYIEFAWNEYGFENSYLGITMGKMLEKAFCENLNRNNKIWVRVYDINLKGIEKLKMNKDIGYRVIGTGKNMHAKDFLMSYVKDGVRQNVSILTSCNFIPIAFHHRTNSILVIKENKKTGGNFYRIMGQKYTDGMIHRNDDEHKYKTESTVEATLTKDGKITYKCSCGQHKDETVYYPKTFTLSKSAYTYDGKAKTPTVTVKDRKGRTLKEGTDYTVSYEDGRKLPGKYTVKITFMGKYDGVKRLYFTIAPKEVTGITATQTTSTVTLSWKAVTGAKYYRVYKYNTKKKKYESYKDTKKTSLKISELKAGTVYTYKIRAYITDDDTIWGAYSSAFETATMCKTPSLKTVVSSKKGTVSVTWSDVSGESGYQLYYSSKKDSGYKKVKSYKTNTLKGSKSELKSGKTYYFKVRAYTKTDSGTVYSSWSKVKNIKAK